MYNHHNEKLIRPIIKKLLNNLDHKYKLDCSPNDSCACITKVVNTNDCIVIYLPNSTKTDFSNEEFSTFQVYLDDSNWQGEMIECKTLEETFEAIKEIESSL